MNVKEHYDLLVCENNDPVRDPESLRTYMDGWDGARFVESMRLDESKSVLEIGVGTGRLALRTAPLCKHLVGIDLSPRSVERAKENLSVLSNVELICDDFLEHSFSSRFDVIYSSLTFLHIEDKARAIGKVVGLLAEKGVFVLSIDMEQSRELDYGTRKIKLYPDDPEEMRRLFSNVALTLLDFYETERAYILVGQKQS